MAITPSIENAGQPRRPANPYAGHDADRAGRGGEPRAGDNTAARAVERTRDEAVITDIRNRPSVEALNRQAAPRAPEPRPELAEPPERARPAPQRREEQAPTHPVEAAAREAETEPPRTRPGPPALGEEGIREAVTRRTEQALEEVEPSAPAPVEEEGPPPGEKARRAQEEQAAAQARNRPIAEQEIGGTVNISV